MEEVFQQRTVASYADKTIRQTLRDHWQWLFGLGFVLVMLGLIAIMLATFTTFISVIFFGFVLLLNGSLLSYQAFKLWRQSWGRLIYSLGVGILYSLIGLIFIMNPWQGALSLTLLLAIAYIILGLYRMLLVITYRHPGWSWLLLSAALTLMLGALILFNLSTFSFWIIGVFLGVDILFIGLSYIMLALSAKEAVSS